MSWRTRGRREDEKRKEWKRADDIRGGEDTERTQRRKGIENATPVFHAGLLAATCPFNLMGKKEPFSATAYVPALELNRLSNGIWLCVWSRVLGVGLRTSQMLEKCSLTELQPRSFFTNEIISCVLCLGNVK